MISTETILLVCITGVAWAAFIFRPVRAPRTVPAPVPVVFIRTWRATSPEEWAIAFREWPDSDPRWRAVWDLLSHHLEAELAAGEGITGDPHRLAQWSGRVQMCLFLRSQMLNLRNVPQ